ncbi:MAG: hypothetical protein EON56_00965 [Alphaproteobacteria bacterium]|nr:MAG: hypothetical protein EON56_00965 [Alphaproteobacteria bacterium]
MFAKNLICFLPDPDLQSIRLFNWPPVCPGGLFVFKTVIPAPFSSIKIGKIKHRSDCLGFCQRCPTRNIERSHHGCDDEGRPLTQRFNPSQPRVPAGTATGGQWVQVTGSVGKWVQGSESGNQRIQLAGVRRLTEDECEDLYKRDTFHRNMVGLAS